MLSFSGALSAHPVGAHQPCLPALFLSALICYCCGSSSSALDGKVIDSN